MSDLLDWLNESYEEVIVLDGWNKHIVGRVSRFGQPDVLLYDREGMLNEMDEATYALHEIAEEGR